jgi:hydroxymethylpyrimidine pyrophosphatase-like HAD family hydrolase
MAIRLVVTDLDGTLWGDDEVVPASTVRAIDGLARRGVDLLVATARGFQSAVHVLRPAGVQPPAVLMSGAVGADLATGHEWHRVAFDVRAGQRVVGVFRSHGVEPVVYVGSAQVGAIAAADCSSHPHHLASFDGGLVREAPDPAIAAGRVVGFGLVGDDGETLARVVEDLGQDASAWLGPTLGDLGGWTLKVAPRGVDKTTGIRAWTEAREIDPAQVIAVGDGSNDLGMLAWAGTAVAVSARDADVGAAADHHLDGPRSWHQLLDLVT